MTTFPSARSFFCCWLALKSLLRLSLWGSPPVFLNWISLWFLFCPQWSDTEQMQNSEVQCHDTNERLDGFVTFSSICMIMMGSSLMLAKTVIIDHYPKWGTEFHLPVSSMNKSTTYILFLTAFRRPSWYG